MGVFIVMLFSHVSSVSISPITPVHPVFLSSIPISHPSLCHLQKQLMSAVAVLERRVQWLSSGSRQIWGTVCEQRYCRTLGFSPLTHSYQSAITHKIIMSIISLACVRGSYFLSQYRDVGSSFIAE